MFAFAPTRLVEREPTFSHIAGVTIFPRGRRSSRRSSGLGDDPVRRIATK